MKPIVNSVEILDCVFDPDLDLYAVLGRATAASKKPFKAGWLSRDQEHFIELQHFSRQSRASQHFNDAAHGDITPESNAVYEDHQRHAVYAWEDEYIAAFATKLDETDMQKLVRKVARMERQRAPKIRFKEEGRSSHFLPADYAIEFGHRDDITVLHEMAHAIHFNMNDERGKDYVNHAPQFVWILIGLYSKYANFNYQYLTTSAYKAGILGDMDAKHNLHPDGHMDLS